MKIKILIIHTAFIGDIVLSTPFIKKIYEEHKDCEITYLTTPLGKEILKNNPYLNEIIVYDKRNKHKGILGFFSILKVIRSKKFDICFTVHRYFRSTILTYLSLAKTKIGYSDAVFAFLFNKRVFRDKKKHEVERILNLLETKQSKRYEIEIFPGSVEKENIDKLLGNVEGKKIITIAPGSNWKTKCWPADYFKELISYFSQNNDLKLVVVGGEKEKEISLDLDNNTIDLRGKTSLLDLAEIIRRSDILLSNDSSPLHIASSFESVRIIGIFGPTAKELGFFPWSSNSIIIENNDIDCRPCSLHGTNICPKKHFKCMLDIKPEMVIEEIKKSLKT